MFYIECDNRISARDTLAQAKAEAQYNHSEFGLASKIRRDGALVAVLDSHGKYWQVVRNLH
jgi:hypothetical protein